MKRAHFDALRPICAACLAQEGRYSALKIAFEIRADAECIHEGALQCTEPACLCEFPIIDDIPILVPDVRAFLADNLSSFLTRDDLSEEIESMLAEAAGPGTALDQRRQHVSTYIRDHYGDFDPEEPDTEPRPGSVVNVLQKGLELLGRAPAAPVLDFGCAAGRTTFELAGRANGLVLGVDVNVGMLRLASQALHQGRVRYARRRLGMLYDYRDFEVAFERSENVDFWACDVLALPFAPQTFADAFGFNVLDCVAAPLELLRSLARVLRGSLVLSTPFDWSGQVTPPGAWVGGHSKRSPAAGASEAVLRALLTPGGHAVSVPGLEFVAAADVPWQLRVHDRSVVRYETHLVLARLARVGPDCIESHS